MTTSFVIRVVEGDLFDSDNTPLQPPQTVLHGKGQLKILASEAKRFVVRLDANGQRVFATEMVEDGDYVCLANEVLYTPADSVVRQRLLARVKQLGAKAAPLPRTVTRLHERTAYLDRRGRYVDHIDVKATRWECNLPLQEMSEQRSSDKAKAQARGYWTDTVTTKLSVPGDAVWLRQCTITSGDDSFTEDYDAYLVSPGATVEELEELLGWLP